ncbi:hypothetical protein TrVE_jg9929 [Triparma verrucosa]|uniref:Uncharacterized protein n=1 Tax=Triparma verrucosa TaxID=1606542 RepID=A0A9W7F8G2_9STRA|nr:hypothetical protein TrVE_jg9929 [Triparma verrucosa]
MDAKRRTIGLKSVEKLIPRLTSKYQWTEQKLLDVIESILHLSSLLSVFPFPTTSSYNSFKYSQEIDRLDVEDIFNCFVDRHDDEEGDESFMERVDVAKYFGRSKNQMRDLAREQRKILIKEDKRRRR